jgi:chromosome partitioning protein
MKTIALFSQEGGSGKSTLAIHLAVAASDVMPVLLVDCDPQGTALAWSMARQARTPTVVRGDAGSARALLAQAKASGTKLVILDCPPHAAAATASLLQLGSTGNPDTVELGARPDRS